MTATLSTLYAFAFDAAGIVIDNTAGGKRLTLANVRATPPCQSVHISVESAQIRWTVDGTAPTSTVGHLANPTDTIDLTNRNNIENFRAIRAGATSATIWTTYYR